MALGAFFSGCKSTQVIPEPWLNEKDSAGFNYELTKEFEKWRKYKYIFFGETDITFDSESSNPQPYTCEITHEEDLWVVVDIIKDKSNIIEEPQGVNGMSLTKITVPGERLKRHKTFDIKWVMVSK